MWQTIQDAIDEIRQLRTTYEAEHGLIEMDDEELATYVCAIHRRQDILNQCRWVVIERLIKNGHLREGKSGIFAIPLDELKGNRAGEK